MKMSSLSRVGLGLSVIFICLLLALIGEIYYLLWWKRRIIKRDIEVNCRKSRNEIGSLFFWKKQANSTPNSQIHHQSTTEQEFQFHPQNTSKNYMLTSLNENGGFEAFTGPPRFLFTINEETREDLAESEDGREGKKSLSDLLNSVEISNPNNINTSPNYLTPISSPQYGTPPITPIGSCHSSQSGVGVGYNPFYESSNDAEFSKIVKSSSPPPKFKFLRDAEEKLQRRIMLMEKEEDEEGKNGGSSLFKKCEEDGSFIRIIVAKNKENEKGIHHYHSPLFYSGDSSSSQVQMGKRGSPIQGRLRREGTSQQQEEEASASDSAVPESPHTSQEPHSPPSTTGLSRRVLDPNGLWFEDDRVKGDITDVIKGEYHQPWKNYSSVDSRTKEHWFHSFSQRYTWSPEILQSVRQGFDKYCTARVRGIFYTVTKKMNNKRPLWISEDVHQKMFDVLVKDDEYIRRSEINKKNRRGGSMDNPVEPTHFQGSISAVQHARKLAEKNKGKLPDAADLFLHTHFKEVPNVGRVAANKSVQAIADKFEQLQHESQSSEDGSQSSANDMFYEASGGRTKKGRVRGLGKGAEMYYATQNSGRTTGSASQFSPSILSQVEQRFEAKLEVERVDRRAERAEMQAEFDARIQAERAERAETERRYKAYMDQLMEQFNQMQQCSNVPPRPRDPRDDDGSSGAGLGFGTVF